MRLHNRQVKAAFWEDPKLMRLPRDARTLFHGLWHLADDSGCLECDTFAFKTFLFRSPLDDDMSIERLDVLTQQLITVELLIPYEAARKQCLFVRYFHKHQSLRSPAPPDVPLPPWVVWQASQEKQRSGTYVVNYPDPESDGERTDTVRKPYGDHTEPKGNQARARNEPEPEPELEEEPLISPHGGERSGAGAPPAAQQQAEQGTGSTTTSTKKSKEPDPYNQMAQPLVKKLDAWLQEQGAPGIVNWPVVIKVMANQLKGKKGEAPIPAEEAAIALTAAMGDRYWRGEILAHGSGIMRRIWAKWKTDSLSPVTRGRGYQDHTAGEPVYKEGGFRRASGVS